MNSILFENGRALSQAQIDSAEEDDLSNSSLKAVTFKCPDYLVEALDAFASRASANRSALISDILTQYFGDALVNFQEGYLSNFSDQGHTLEQRIQIESVALTEDLSPNAAHFIFRSVQRSLEV